MIEGISFLSINLNLLQIQTNTNADVPLCSIFYYGECLYEPGWGLEAQYVIDQR